MQFFSNPLLLFGRDFEINSAIGEPVSFYFCVMQEVIDVIDPMECLPIIHCLGRLTSIWNVEWRYHLYAFNSLGHITKKLYESVSKDHQGLIHSILLVIERYVEKLDNRVQRVGYFDSFSGRWTI